MNENIDKIFNLESKEIIKPPSNTSTEIVSQEKLPEKTDLELLDDYKKSRTDYDMLMEQGQTALEEVLDIARAGQHPRFYEAVALLIKTLAETNASRIDVHTKIAQIRKLQADIGAGPTTKIDKAIFVGSTSELLKYVKPRTTNEETQVDVEYEEENNTTLNK